MLRKFLIGLLVVLVLLAALYAALALLARPAPRHPWFDGAAAPDEAARQPLVFAHQGGEGIRPSNTMLAFDHAVQLGADVLDADMHVTRDGVLVLMHDQTVDRTTDGTGAIRDLTLDQIRQLDAAHDFSPDGGQTFPYRGQGITVPTLEELFTRYPNHRFGIEIKQTPPEVAAPFCDLIRRHNLQARVLVSSFRQANMDAFRRACPEVATSATQDEVLPFFILSSLGLEAVYSPPYQSLQVPETFSGLLVVRPRFIEAARRRGLAVQPWTINEEDDLKRMIALGVDGINTDFPDRLLNLLR